MQEIINNIRNIPQGVRKKKVNELEENMSISNAKTFCCVKNVENAILTDDFLCWKR